MTSREMGKERRRWNIRWGAAGAGEGRGNGWKEGTGQGGRACTWPPSPGTPCSPPGSGSPARSRTPRSTRRSSTTPKPSDPTAKERGGARRRIDPWSLQPLTLPDPPSSIHDRISTPSVSWSLDPPAPPRSPRFSDGSRCGAVLRRDFKGRTERGRRLRLPSGIFVAAFNGSLEVAERRWAGRLSEYY